MEKEKEKEKVDGSGVGAQCMYDHCNVIHDITLSKYNDTRYTNAHHNTLKYALPI